MASPLDGLIEPLLERDENAIRDAIHLRFERQPAGEALDDIIRFSLLAFAPSQHGIGALLATVAASELLEATDAERLVSECAIYAARVRQPWSEAPITDPPNLTAADEGSPEQIARAIDSHDRLAAERWLARILEAADAKARFFDAATADAGDGGQNAIVAVAAWRLASRFPARYRYAALRVATATWTTTAPLQLADAGSSTAEEALAHALSRFLTERGSPLAFQGLLAADAARFLAGEELVEAAARVAAVVPRGESTQHSAVDDETPLEPYELSRDFGAWLHCHALAKRWNEVSEEDRRAMIAAAKQNLDATSYSEWTFA
jgi:hypothetical protein